MILKLKIESLNILVLFLSSSLWVFKIVGTFNNFLLNFHLSLSFLYVNYILSWLENKRNWNLSIRGKTCQNKECNTRKMHESSPDLWHKYIKRLSKQRNSQTYSKTLDFYWIFHNIYHIEMAYLHTSCLYSNQTSLWAKNFIDLN